MPFRPNINDCLWRNYRFTEHPAAPGMPYGQTGRRATVYQLQSDEGGLHALKVFTSAFRFPYVAESADKLRVFSGLPGLKVCQRLVLTPQRYSSLIKQYPDLLYAALMPWAEGTTWQELMLTGHSLTTQQSLALARELLTILTNMEAHGLAHCDLSGSNIMVQLQPLVITLVDVEDLFGSGLQRPDKPPGGSAGYAHKTAPRGLWSAEADRFAGAVVLAEMLGWCDERIRKTAQGEHYFQPEAMQQNTEAYSLMLRVLHERWGWRVAQLFETAWNSRSLKDCSSMGTWSEALKTVGDGGPIIDGPPIIPDEPESVLTATARHLYDALKQQHARGNLDEAARLAQALEVLWPDYADARVLLEQIQQEQEHLRRLQASAAIWQPRLEQKRQELLAEDGALSQERESLRAQLAALDDREVKLHQRHDKLKEAEQLLETTQSVLGTVQWREAETYLEQLDSIDLDALA